MSYLNYFILFFNFKFLNMLLNNGYVLFGTVYVLRLVVK
jgi:hypothetical protein